jgi:hypothetical protein
MTKTKANTEVKTWWQHLEQRNFLRLLPQYPWHRVRRLPQYPHPLLDHRWLALLLLPFLGIVQRLPDWTQFPGIEIRTPQKAPPAVAQDL